MLFRKTYTTPPASILPDHESKQAGEIYSGEKLAKILSSKVPCSFIRAVVAPQLVSYHFALENPLELPKVKRLLEGVSAILHTEVKQASSDIAHFALEIPRADRSTLYFKQALLTKDFDRAAGLSALFGVDTLNRPLVVNIQSLPHALIGGTTGGGKSVLLNSIAVSLLFKHTPETMQFIIIDPKQVEFSGFAGLPHLLRPVVTDPYLAIDTLASVCDMIDQRYKRMAAHRVKNAAEMGLPSVVVMIDELADLIILGKKPVETAIVRIAQLGRAAGVHLIVATQQPTVNVVTGLIKANIPCRIALKTATVSNSMVILDGKGAEKLTGKGDALLKLPDRTTPIRFQAPLIESADIAPVIKYWSK